MNDMRLAAKAEEKEVISAEKMIEMIEQMPDQLQHEMAPGLSKIT